MEKNKSLTKDDLMNALAGFNDDFLVPKFDAIDKKFEAMDEKINRAKQEVMDYTDKRVGEAEGRIVPKISALTNVLKNKEVIDSGEAKMVRKAGVVG